MDIKNVAQQSTCHEKIYKQEIEIEDPEMKTENTFSSNELAANQISSNVNRHSFDD